MTRWGHFLTSASLAFAIYESAQTPENPLAQIASVTSTLISTDELYAPRTLGPFMCAAGVMVGSMLPDQLEFARYNNQERASVIPHRTLTHWPLLWLAGLSLSAYGLLDWVGSWYIAAVFSLGLCLSALLHLALDFGSQSGIPLYHPAGRPTSLAIYATGAPSELMAIVVVSGVFIAIGVML